MLTWVYNWWYGTSLTENKSSGPARNAPHENIKSFVENKPAEMIIISQSDVLKARENLHKVEPTTKPDFYTSPLIKELHSVFRTGSKNFLEQKRSKSSIF